MDAYPGRPFYITVASLRKVDTHLAKHENLGEITNVQLKIVHVKDERYSYASGEHASSNDSSVNGIQYKRAPVSLE